MRNSVTIFISILLSVVVSITTMVVLDRYFIDKNPDVLSIEATPVPTPLAKYKIENLSKVRVESKEIEILEELDKREDSTTFLFKHTFDPTFDGGNEKTVTGTINVPNEKQKYPLVFLIRGYVDKEIYSPGLGTKNAGIYFSNNGFLTIAPDFLGYADSDTESFNVFEARFQTYTTAMSLLKSLDTLQNWDGKNIFIWAHSNGGQIALTTLAVSEAEYPTTLWAPVTKPFPYSILYFTDELFDQGKYIRTELAKFEAVYDVDKFSFTNYLDNIKAPLHIHQGGNDDAIPLEWSQDFANNLDEAEVVNKLFIYPTADHNMRPNWDDAINTDLEFFLDNLK